MTHSIEVVIPEARSNVNGLVTYPNMGPGPMPGQTAITEGTFNVFATFVPDATTGTGIFDAEMVDTFTLTIRGLSSLQGQLLGKKFKLTLEEV
jgi:hypothetical protein